MRHPYLQYIIYLILVLMFISLLTPRRPQKQEPTVVEQEPGLLDIVTEGEAQVIDLTYPLNERNAYWPGGRYQPFKHEVLARLETDSVFSGSYSTPEHLGTHIDAPNHFEPNQPSVDQIPLSQLIGPAVVIDVHTKITSNPDYQVSVEDILDWESQNGPVPKGAVVLMHSGWGARWESYPRYKNADATGALHFPGFSKEAALFLAEERDIKGVGVDTLSVDHGPSKDFAVHHVFNSRGKWILENLDNLEKLPSKGAALIVAPIKIEGGSGGQARVWVIINP